MTWYLIQHAHNSAYRSDIDRFLEAGLLVMFLILTTMAIFMKGPGK